MNETLLPCPFCGCKDIDEYEGDYGNGVYCINCGAMMGEQIHREFHVHERVGYEQAAEAWNTRAERTCEGIRWQEMFGTPERAARTLEKGKTLCAWCDKQTCSTNGGECRIFDYDALLEWLRGDAE